MYAPFARSDYYEASAPPDNPWQATSLPTAGPAARRIGRSRMVPTFTTRSITEGGAHLYPSSIATTTPQTFIMASLPDLQAGFGVDHPHNQWPRAASRPVFIRFEPSATLRGVGQWFLAYTFPALLAGPEPSDDADPPRALSGPLSSIRAFPRIDCP